MAKYHIRGKNVEAGTSPEVGHSTFFFGRFVPHGFPKVGSREWIFFEKLGVLGMKLWEICILRAEILAKNKAENAHFFSKN